MKQIETAVGEHHSARAAGVAAQRAQSIPLAKRYVPSHSDVRMAQDSAHGRSSLAIAFARRYPAHAGVASRESRTAVTRDIRFSELARRPGFTRDDPHRFRQLGTYVRLRAERIARQARDDRECAKSPSWAAARPAPCAGSGWPAPALTSRSTTSISPGKSPAAAA